MNGQLAQLAQRGLGDLLRPPEWPPISFWIKYCTISAVVALGLGLSGQVWPGPLLPALPRTILWVSTALLTALQWIAADALLRPWCKSLRLPALMLLGTVPLVLAPACAVEYAFVARAFGLLREMPFEAAALLFAGIFLRNAYTILFPTVLVIRWCIVRSRAAAPRPLTHPPAPTTPATAESHALLASIDDCKLSRLLPPSLRAPIVALKAEDHYVRVFTERGDGLVLMRFGDAIGQVAASGGARVHRSYWVRESAICRLSRAGRRCEIHLKGGLVVPVSRAHENAVKAWIATQRPDAQ